jgi:signal peptidase I
MKSFLASIIVVFYMSPFNISGDSMEPFLSDGDVIMTESLTYADNEPARGDIVVFYGTDEPDKFFVKRIIGLPGETIKISEDNVYVIDEDGDQTKIEEPYLSKSAKAYSLRQIDGTSYEIPEGSYFVLGDNRDSSFDSRTWKNPFVPKNNIVGKYYFVLF